MLRHHRAFLGHITANRRPIRQLVEGKDHPELVSAYYNRAVDVVKAFRDAHIRIVAIYIIGPASQERACEGQGDSVGHGADASHDAGG